MARTLFTCPFLIAAAITAMCGRFVRFRTWAELRRTMTLLTPGDVAAELRPWMFSRASSPRCGN